MTLLGVRVRAHPLTALFSLLALRFGEGSALLAYSLALIPHELAHILMAKQLGVAVYELELLPFGGAARMENFWQLRPGQVCLTALAGPMANLLLLILAAALQTWFPMSSPFIGLFTRANLSILLFNLLPALPLDGGRTLCGLLATRLCSERAAKIGSILSGSLGIALLIPFAYALCAKSPANLALPISAAYIFASIGRERSSARAAGFLSALSRGATLTRAGTMPLRILAAQEDTPPKRLAASLTPNRVHLFALFDRQMRLTRWLDEEALLQSLVKQTGK